MRYSHIHCNNVHGKTLASLIALATLSALPSATAQTWDSSGNGQLHGTYYFREVVWFVATGNGADGTLGEAIAAYGNIVFDGNGNYTLSNAQVCDSSSCFVPANVQSFQASGTYSISASGYGFIKGLSAQNESIYGLTSPQGIFIGSSTDNSTGFNDLFIAAPLPSPAPTNSFFTGTYVMGNLDFPGVNTPSGVLATRAGSFQLTPDGNGGLGPLTATGYIAGNGTVQTHQVLSGLRYLFSGGAAVINFGGSPLANNTLIAGTQYLYFSPDGNFVFGGSPSGWNMLVGVRIPSARLGSPMPPFSGLYYQAGVEQDDSTVHSGYAATSSHFGSLLALPGLILGHRRVFSVFNNNVFDYTHSDGYTANSDGTYDDPYDHYTFTADGKMAVGLGTGSLLGINVLLQSPQFTPSGVYISPTGIVNAGSSAPFTAGLAPGELVSIYGSGFSSTTAIDPSLPGTLAGVQVLVNGTPAPLYGVAHGDAYDQINAIIPLTTQQGVASIQVVSNGVPSNTITNFVNMTQPGIFNSFASPAILHADNSLVTAQNPVQPGETLSVYLTGLGTLDTSGNATNKITAYIGGTQAAVTFAGSYSPVGGGYQVNVTVPSGVSNGNAYLDISGPDAYNSEALIPIGTTTTSAPATRIAHRPVPPAMLSPASNRVKSTRLIRSPR